MDDLNLNKLARLKAKMKGEESEFYRSFSLLIPDGTQDFIELSADIIVHQGFFSNVAVQRLKQQFNQEVLSIKGKVILTNAIILVIKKELFLGRKDLISFLDKMELEGNMYQHQNYVYCPIFPIDLIIQKNVEIKKWNFR